MLTYGDFGVAPDSGFNLEAANAVYDLVMGMDDDEARGFLRVLAFDGITSDIEANKGEIQQFVDGFYRNQAETINKRLASTYVSKRAAGEDTDSLIAAAEAIRKASNYDDYTSFERHDNAERQTRGAHGRWVAMNKRPINYGTQDRELSGKQAEILGVPGHQLTKEDQKNFREAYLQVRDYLSRELNNVAPGEALVEMTYVSPVFANGKFTRRYETSTATHMKGGDAKADAEAMIDAEKFKNGGRLSSVQVHAATDLSVNGAAFGLMSALSNDRVANYGMGVAPKIGPAIDSSIEGSFSQQWNRQSTINGQNTRVYDRLNAASGLVDTLTPNASPKMKLAIGAGKWLGQYGPEAEKIIGPTARKSAYRYRGIERKPEVALAEMVENTDRNAILFPRTERVQAKNGGLKEVTTESPVINYFVRRLPKANLYELQLNSGTVPPSEGIIIDRKGRVVTQAVGYGDDWYLPFNLRNVGKLNGGEYIRTRAVGGLTTEDIYTGLVAGARRVTVISRSGVFTMEFDDNFRGNRRYSDKAARMVSRYGHILDAVQSGKTTPSLIPEDRMEEIDQQIANFGLEDDQRQAMRTRAIAKERDNPQLSKKRIKEIQDEVINDAAADVQTPTGMPMNGEEYVRMLMGREAQRLQATGMDNARIQGELNHKFGNADAVLDSIGMTEVANRKVETALREYAQSIQALKLDGNGYNYAAQALREQFPYYIKEDVRYRRTPDIMGVAQGTPGRKDLGYVKPNFNRAAGAQSGYYDTSITGHGKISADQTNYQNGGYQNKLSSTGSESHRAEPTGDLINDNKESAPKAPPTRLDQADALVSLAKHFKSKIGTIVTDKDGNQVRLTTANIAQFDILGAQHIENGRDVTDDRLRKMIASPNSDVRAKLEKELVDARNIGIKLDDDIVNAFMNPGAVREKKDVSTYNAANGLLDPSADYNFGMEFAPNRRLVDYMNVYSDSNQKAIAGIKSSLGLKDLLDPSTEAALDTFITMQQEKDRSDREYARNNARRLELNPNDRPIGGRDARLAFDTATFNAVRLKQLIRYAKKAQAAELANEPEVEVQTTVVREEELSNVIGLDGKPIALPEMKAASAGGAPIDLDAGYKPFHDNSKV